MNDNGGLNEETECTTSGNETGHTYIDNGLGSDPEDEEPPGRITPQIPSPRPNGYSAINPDQSSSVTKEAYNAQLLNNDDQYPGSEAAERNPLAFADRRRRFGEADVDTILSRPPASVSQSHLRVDYQLQLLLLEQQNKKRVMMELEETEEKNNRTPGANSDASPESSANDDLQSHGHLHKQALPSVITDLQHFLEGRDTSQLDLVKLQEHIELLQRQLKQLGPGSKEQKPPRFQILNRIRERRNASRKGRTRDETSLWALYFDEPEWVSGHGDELRMQCKLPIANFDLYLEKNKDISFIVYRSFDPAPAFASSGGRDLYLSPPQATSETIQLISQVLVEAIEEFLETREEYSGILQQFKSSSELQAPYLFMYHSRKDLDAIQANLSFRACQETSLLLGYINSRYGDRYATADALFARGKITSDHVPFIFQPGDILIHRKDGRYEAFLATDWPSMCSIEDVSRLEKIAHHNEGQSTLHGAQEAMRPIRHRKNKFQSWSAKGWHWVLNDGGFQRQYETHQFDIEVLEADKRDIAPTSRALHIQEKEDLGAREMNITDLHVFPMKYADAQLVETLGKRGRTFWKCRNPRLVSYLQGDKQSAHNMVAERYMIDVATYGSLHSDSSVSRSHLLDELRAEAVGKDEPPDETFYFLFPAEIKGYNLRLKRWHDLEVDRISEVVWNVEAFQSLVIDRIAKDLIRALVSKQLAAEKATDLIVGKGNGLILLLHGGPGTGKTLTAESIAEIAQKPLYRVTCGDVGTKAEDAEKYLESVFHLGRIWRCVLLLDEADVFLEQRSLADLQRNALVSVFLRVMEYYEGILVLTSNRVGTFDEAFKSRIQLALHYPSLGNTQRMRIWENFIKRLESFDDDTIDIEDLRYNLEDLSNAKMNGREIRNAITTARQYAEWKGTKMKYRHLREVIEVAGRFDKYLDTLHSARTADQLAEDDGVRLAGNDRLRLARG
ncbi:hypothetical protein PV11_03205 [Exophiala sideris]|uniref:AAA+ ATPase domain-containing protein n=1 Tax=Exophiala sideris TaxID=1016849 RepID=A0A0D1Z1B5_9EURO|nr:hypothetical protein PV11_03205 [Exophiala sideris]